MRLKPLYKLGACINAYIDNCIWKHLTGSCEISDDGLSIINNRILSPADFTSTLDSNYLKQEIYFPASFDEIDFHDSFLYLCIFPYLHNMISKIEKILNNENKISFMKLPVLENGNQILIMDSNKCNGNKTVIRLTLQKLSDKSYKLIIDCALIFLKYKKIT